jgi:signal transduction histidine kinase
MLAFQQDARESGPGGSSNGGEGPAGATELEKAQAELRRAVALREERMGILGHELLNPVSAVRGLASLLQLDRSLPPQALERLARIEQAGRRMSEMIETLLDVTRVQFHDHLQVSPSDMDFGELCRNVMDEVQAAQPGRELVLETRGDLHGQGDYHRLAQVVSNLLRNAVIHGDRQAPVSLRVRSDSSFVTVDVVNQGPAIPAAQIPALFEPFVQGPATGVKRRAGLGLGLYIARQIVEAHGGTLTAQSSDGETTFTARVPRQ